MLYALTCFHDFRIFDFRNFFTIFFFFSFKTSQNFSIEIKNVAKTVYFSHKKTLCSSCKRKQDIYCEKKSGIRRFGILENMSRASYQPNQVHETQKTLGKCVTRSSAPPKLTLFNRCRIFCRLPSSSPEIGKRKKNHIRSVIQLPNVRKSQKKIVVSSNTPKNTHVIPDFCPKGLKWVK